MNGPGRLIFGAIVGALIALVAHPTSRPFLALGFTQLGPSNALAESPLLEANLSVLPQPDTLQEAGIWMSVGAERISTRRDLSDANLRAMLKVADAAAELDPENAFWTQMGAVFAEKLGDRAGCIERWNRGSRRTRWNDYQTTRLNRAASLLRREAGSDLAWIHARLAMQRSRAASQQIDRLAALLVSNATLSDPKGLEMRYVTLANGRLLRRGARSIEIGLQGVSIIENASLSGRRTGDESPRKLLISRFEFINALRSNNRQSDAEEASQTFDENEGWYVLVERGQARQETDRMAWLAVAAATLPSSLLMAGIAGLILWGLAWLFGRFPGLQRLTMTPVAPLLGAIIAGAVFLSTQLTFVALAVAACFGFLGFGPNRERTQPTRDLGPLFSFTMLVVSLVMVALLSGFWAGLLRPAYEVGQTSQTLAEPFVSGGLLVGLAGIVFLLVLLFAPTWAIVQRLSTPFVFVEALTRLGRNMAVAGFVLGILATPLAVMADNSLAESLSKILQNEPNYYLTQWAP